MNLDDGDYVKTKFWMPFMSFLRNKEEQGRRTRMRSTNEESTNGSRLYALEQDVTSNIDEASNNEDTTVRSIEDNTGLI